ncbi:hypothetical protein BJ165DRAFT_1494229 [Panaeolus papilionaceus]|nr:hypothetical protein BJ165DRAFT_1494229 [Panaeolus papilionaceus]
MKRRVETKADEDRMADRLQLDIQQNSLTQQNTKSMGVTVFRGVSFGDWLRLFMQILLHPEETSSIQCR